MSSEHLQSDSTLPDQHSGWRAYLELVRVPNLFTAAADSMAGYLTVTGGRPEISTLGAIVTASVCLYAGGIVLNDYFDYPLDRLERPERPLPSGRVSLRTARFVAVLLFAIAGVAAAWVGPSTLLLAGGITLAATVYDSVGKNTPLGPINMGTCRFLNLLLGVSAAPELLFQRSPLALLLLLHIVGVTYLSRDEVTGGVRRGVTISLVSLTSVILGTALVWSVGGMPDPSFLPFLLLFAMVTLRPSLRCLREPEPANIRAGVKAGVLGLVLLDAAFAAGYGGPLAGLLVALLIVPSALIARAFAVT